MRSLLGHAQLPMLSHESHASRVTRADSVLQLIHLWHGFRDARAHRRAARVPQRAPYSGFKAGDS